MKIIGTANDEYILQATKDEVAKIYGVKWWSGNLTEKLGRPEPGTVIPVSILWGLIEGIQISEDARREAIGAIDALAKLIKGVDETLEEYIEEVKQKSRRFTKDGTEVKDGSPEK